MLMSSCHIIKKIIGREFLVKAEFQIRYNPYITSEGIENRTRTTNKSSQCTVLFQRSIR